MKYYKIGALVIVLGILFSCTSRVSKNIQNTAMKEVKKSLIYPDTKRENISDNYHGTTIMDPYRWLEDDHSEETKAWVKEQNAVTNKFLDKIDFRKDIQERLTTLWDYEKLSAPFKEGDYYYFFKNDGLQNQSVLYRSKTIGGDAELVLDPNKLSEDGTSSLGGISFNKDGSRMAYMVSEGGSDWRTAYVMDMKSLKLLVDRVEWIKFSSISWSKNGFFYSRYPKPDENDELSAKNEYHKIYYHELGTSSYSDAVIQESQDHPTRNFYGYTTEDQKYLIISSSEGTSGNGLTVMNTDTRKKISIVDKFDHDFNVIDNEGRDLLVMTNYKAPNLRVIKINLDQPDEANWTELIPESTDKLESVSNVGGRLFLKYIHNATGIIKVYGQDGKYQDQIKLPGIGNASNISGKKKDTEGFFSFTSYTNPSTIYSLNTKDLSYKVYNKPKLDFNPADFITKQIWYTSKDGTKIPMFVTHKKDLVLDGTNPTLLYGYGGFNISLLPGFSLTRVPLLENGGVYVVANIRGGGEFGTKWHKSGTQGQKQNVFDDFQAAAEKLIELKYTQPSKLAIEGGSNGGLLVGACMTQRPDLYAVAFPAVGVLDMLRYHKFTIGWAWAGDYGRSDDAEAFNYLIKYSPLHNIKNIAYPATMVTTADHDDRVVPAHSFKFISELQHKHVGENPVLIRIETSAGHGAGKPTDKLIEEASDKLGFMLYNMNETYKIQ